ncbi:MAG: translocation/assembly module TamB domain-containing protein, partial [Calditrichia bacterium]
MAKKTGKIIGFIFLGIILLVLLLLIFIQLPPGENILKGIAENQLGGILNQQVEIGDLETNLFGRIQLHDVRIHEKSAEPQDYFLKLAYGKVEYRLFDLLNQKLTIKSVLLDSLQVDMRRDSSGFINVPILNSSEKSQPDTSSGGFSFSLGEATVKHSSIQFTDYSMGLEATLQKVHLEAIGQSGNYRFSGNIRSGGVIYNEGRMPLNHLQFQGAYTEEALQLDSLSMEFPDLRMHGHLRLELAATPSGMQGQFFLKGNTRAVQDILNPFLPERLRPFQAQMDVVVNLAGTLQNPIIRADMHFPEMKMADLLIRDASLQGAFLGEKIELDTLRMQIADGKLRGEGEIRLNEQMDHRINLTLQNIDFGWLYQTLLETGSPYKGILNGHIASSGPLKNYQNLQVNARLTAEKVKYQNKDVDDFLVRLNYENHQGNLNIRHADAEIQSNFSLNEDRIRAAYSAQIPNLEPLTRFADLSGLSGSLQIEGQMKGTLDNPVLSARVNGQNIIYNHFPVDELKGTVQFENKELQLSDVIARGAVSQIDSTQPPFGVQGLSGGLSYRVEANGTLDSLQAKATAEFSQPEYRHIKFEKGRLLATLKDRDLRLNYLHFSNDSLAMDLKGQFGLEDSAGKFKLAFFDSDSALAPEAPTDSLPPDSMKRQEPDFPAFGTLQGNFDLADSTDMQVQLNGKSIKLSGLALLIPGKRDMSGDLNIDLSFQGSPRSPNGSFHFRVDSATFSGIDLDSLSGDMRVVPGMVHLDSLNIFLNNNHTWASGQVELIKDSTGSYTVGGASSTSGSAHADSMNLSIARAFLGPDTQIEGVASYDLDWQGTLGSPDVKGHFAVKNGSYITTDENVPDMKKLQVNIQLSDNVLQIKQMEGVVADLPFHINGTIPFSGAASRQSSLSLYIKDKEVLSGNGILDTDDLQYELNITDLQLGLLVPFIPKMEELAGTMTGSVTLAGSFSNPDFNGDIAVRGLNIKPAFIEEPFKNGTIKLAFTRDKLSIDSLLLHHGKGTFSITGVIGIQEGAIAELDLKTDIRNVEVNYEDTYKVTVNSADLSYRKSSDEYQLEGNVRLGETRLSYNLQPRELISFLDRAEKPATEPPDIMRNTSLDVRIRESDKIWIDNNLARLRMHSELHLIGTLAQPNVTGRLSVEEGYVMYLDRKFEVRQGVVDFVDPNEIRPIVDLKAEAEVQTYEALQSQTYIITFGVSGRVDEAKISLTSNPPLSQANILSLLTLGATQDELAGSGEGPSTGAILQNRVETLTSRRISGYISGKVGNLLGLE